MAVYVTYGGKWHLVLICGELNALQHLQNNLLGSGGFILSSIMLSTKWKETIYLLFSAFQGVEITRKWFFRKVFQRSEICGNWEDAVWHFLGAILHGEVSLHQGQRQLPNFPSWSSLCRPFRYAFVFRMDLPTNCASHHCLKLNSGPITGVVSWLNFRIYAVKSACISLYTKRFGIVHAPSIVLCNLFSCTEKWKAGCLS